MISKALLAVTLSGLLSLGGTVEPAHAVQRGVTEAGVVFVSGGVAEVEEQELIAQKSRYSFWLTTASKGSGAFLADVGVRILDERSNKLMLEHTMDGPWLFVDLPPGRYRVEASLGESADHRAQTLRRSSTIRRGDHRQMILYFDTSDRVRHELDEVPKVNPYGLK